MRTFFVLAVLSLATPVAADNKPAKAAPAAKKPAATQPGCKKVVVGKGLDRKVFCEVQTEIVLTTSAPKPNVVIINRDGKNVTGRPKAGDRLQGLSPRL